MTNEIKALLSGIEGLNVGTLYNLPLLPILALEVMELRLQRLEKAVEMLHRLKPTQVTTPETVVMRKELDQMLLHHTK